MLTAELHQAGVKANVKLTLAESLDNYVANITCMIQDTTDAHMLKANPSPHTKRWWTADLSQLRCNYAKLSRKEFKARGTLSWVSAKIECSAAWNRYISTLHHTKVSHWQGWLEKITEDDIWKASQLAQGPLTDSSTAKIPTLFERSPTGKVVREYASDEDKHDAFTKIFFPSKPMEPLAYTGDNLPLPTPLGFSTLTINLVCKTILQMHLHKAPGPDKIPNIVLQKTVHEIMPLLHNCLLTILTLRYYPKAWCTWMTIMLYKPAWLDYTTPKAYHPIYLYNTMGKVISATMTRILGYIMMCHNLLPQKCFGRLPSCTTTDSLLYLVHDIKNTWRWGNVITILLLDIVSTFPNVIMSHLLLNMWQLGYPTPLMKLFKAMLTDRHTMLVFDGSTSGKNSNQ